YKTYTWNDRNHDLLWQPGEESQLVDLAGGSTNTLIDPNWKDAVTTEVAGWVEREVAADFGVRSGIIFRRNNNPTVYLNPNRPLSAFSVPVTICVPDESGRVSNPNSCPTLTVYNLNPAYLNVDIVNETTHDPYIDAEHFTTWEITGTKR